MTDTEKRILENQRLILTALAVIVPAGYVLDQWREDNLQFRLIDAATKTEKILQEN